VRTARSAFGRYRRAANISILLQLSSALLRKWSVHVLKSERLEGRNPERRKRQKVGQPPIQTSPAAPIVDRCPASSLSTFSTETTVGESSPSSSFSSFLPISSSISAFDYKDTLDRSNSIHPILAVLPQPFPNPLSLSPFPHSTSSSLPFSRTTKPRETSSNHSGRP
jgi:hypothetical protein